MRGIGKGRLRPLLHQRLGRIAQRARTVDDVIDQDANAPRHIADDVHDLGFASPLPPLVDDRKVRIDAARKRPRPDDTPDIGGHHDDRLAGEVLLDVRLEDGRRKEIVRGNIEEALDLPGMQVQRQDTPGPGLRDDVGNQLRRDRRARAWLSVLASIAKIRNDRRHPLGRGATQRVDADQQLHQVVVGGK